MLVTAVITTYKRHPDVVERALKSILNQTYKHIETFVIDDSPSSFELRCDVEKMVNQYKYENVTYVAHKENLGACAARNTGLSLASGQYIAFLDDDDEWMPKKIEEQLKCFDSSNVALVYCGRASINEDTNIVTEQKLSLHKGLVYDHLILDNFVGSTSFPLIRVDYIKNIGGFDTLMPAAQDYDVWLRLAKLYEFNYTSESLVLYHEYSGERITLNYEKKIAALTRLYEKNNDYLKNNRKAMAEKKLEILMPYVLSKKYSKAIKSLLSALILNPFNFRGNFKGAVRILKGILGLYN